MLEIRPAREDDLPAVAALAVEARDDSPTGAQLGAQDAGRLLEHLSVLLAAGGHVLVAEHNGQVVGVILGRVVAAYLFAHRASLYLDMLFVAPRARRHGVGHALLRAAADLAAEHECDDIYSAPVPGNRGVQRFLARLGFAPAAGHRVVSVAALQRRLATDAAARDGAHHSRRSARGGLEDLIARRRRARSVMESGPIDMRPVGGGAPSRRRPAKAS
ncbi:Ribosomal protein S18 acetylase RimI [Promicromonospora umidemergens]|uniref:N-acetyltransferase domain-containing protein n=1 Tax=Promicromonospora umidemergens TaxID=629679 RepID=A0ABP8WWZ3_9MICO|nr:GNAT family N-acetyltransferase [Promicromonospora umidemergens]MCP2285780.1 Ribosomal protein S18 acetylase RimI [Promicromonospora umidemergens]